jgi:actin beta/gamma 1
MGDEYEDEEDEDVVVIIDNGSGTCKAGLSTQEVPKVVFPEYIAKPREAYKKDLEKEYYFGHEVDAVRGKVSVQYPLENGIIENFEQMELIWEYTFDTLLGVNTQNHPVLLTEPPYNPKPNRERMVEIMFETFGVPSLNISIQGVLAFSARAEPQVSCWTVVRELLTPFRSLTASACPWALTVSTWRVAN